MQERGGPQFEQIDAFVAVVEHGGISAAARALDRDPSVISRRLDALEARLGVRLLSRTTRRITLTEAGGTYLTRVRTVLSELAAAESEAAEGASVARGLLRLSLPATYARRWIAPRLPEFVAAYPEVQLELRHTDRFVDLVAEGYDAAVRIGELSDSGLVVRRFAPVETILCASPDYVARKGAPVKPADLESHECLRFPMEGFRQGWKLRSGAEHVTQRVSGSIVSDEGEGLFAACIAGAGILPASDWEIGQELADGRLVRVLPQWRFDVESAVQVVLPPGRLIPAKTRAFVEWLARDFVPTPPWHRCGPTGQRLS
ncbi:LysR family transcriptional regulator [Salinarimonas soli]|uniref:LysR family transcriptional regulator n=1 Tax=Salinarimonas soli TaxID=1638099 RepID=A0A5B2V854_9HYPH|nr:LysR family transcriptional regulator [Salinarimonas soli]KAA2234640.1 LysR family transcriptional regulator [Salinarimonas soli]